MKKGISLTFKEPNIKQKVVEFGKHLKLKLNVYQTCEMLTAGVMQLIGL